MITLTLSTSNPNVAGLEIVNVYAVDDHIIAIWNISYQAEKLVMKKAQNFSRTIQIDESFKSLPIKHWLVAESLENCDFDKKLTKANQDRIHELDEKAVKIDFKIIDHSTNGEYGSFLYTTFSQPFDSREEPSYRSCYISANSVP